MQNPLIPSLAGRWLSLRSCKCRSSLLIQTQARVRGFALGRPRSAEKLRVEGQGVAGKRLIAMGRRGKRRGRGGLACKDRGLEPGPNRQSGPAPDQILPSFRQPEGPQGQRRVARLPAPGAVGRDASESQPAKMSSFRWARKVLAPYRVKAITFR
jgi:hypothetical protein